MNSQTSGEASRFNWQSLTDPERLVSIFSSVTSWIQVFWAIHALPTVKSMAEWPMILHSSIVLFISWLMGYFGFNPLFSLVCTSYFLWKVYDINKEKQKRKMKVEMYKEQFLGKNSTPDDETARWMNVVMERAWPVFLERVISEKLTPKLAPWFLNTYKPAILTKVDLLAMNMGSAPPVVTSVRAYSRPSEGNDFEMEMSLELSSAPDMFMKFSAYVGSASWAGLGLIPWTAYATDLSLQGTCRVGLRFSKAFPFVDRVAVSFSEEPSLGLSIRVMGMGMGQGFDAAGLPLVADYLKTTLTRALVTSIVAPNRLIIDDIVTLMRDIVEDMPPRPSPTEVPLKHNKKVDNKIVAKIHLEIFKGINLLPSDMNGLSDPYVKGNLGGAKFTTSIKRVTLNPTWNEEFTIPLREWGERTVLRLQVRDYDKFSSDDDLGFCDVDLGLFRDGVRHERMEILKGVKCGKLAFALTVIDEEKPLKGEGGDVELEVGSTSATTVIEHTGDTGDVKKEHRSGKPATVRKVNLCESSMNEVTPGCAIETWDL